MREICQRGERLYLDGVWGGSRGPGLRVIGRGAYLPLKHQQVALSPWAGKASVSGREGGKVLSRVISQIGWVCVRGGGGSRESSVVGLRNLWCLRVVAYGAAAEGVRGGGWAAQLSSPPPRAHPSLQGL